MKLLLRTLTVGVLCAGLAAGVMPATAARPAVTSTTPASAIPLNVPAPVPGDGATADGLDAGLDLVNLATRGQGDWLRYRITALSSLANGDLLAVFDGRPTMNDLPSNIALLSRRSTDGGKT